jgi:peptidoglycan/xylan/chitin deacetylase (PgdA/CDA1 family)
MRGISILMYHQVGDFAPMRGHRSTYCHYQRFAAQMAYLHRLRYNVIRLDAALEMLAGNVPVPPRAVALTFDDGYENFYQYAWPELARHGFPATVYLLSGLLGKNAEWFARDGRATPALMSAARVRELDRAGIDFGSHGVSHVKLAEVSVEKAREEITRSRAELADVLGHEVRHFCYPYGSVNPDVVEAARAAGYRSAVTCVRALAVPGWDLLALPRKAISFGDSLFGYAWKLHIKNKPKADPLAASAPPGG